MLKLLGNNSLCLFRSSELDKHRALYIVGNIDSHEQPWQLESKAAHRP